MKKKLFVTFRVLSEWTAEVEVESGASKEEQEAAIEEAKDKADLIFGEANFGESENIDGEAKYIEDENGNRVWEGNLA